MCSNSYQVPSHRAERAMHVFRKSLFPVALAVALVAAPVFGPVRVAGVPGGVHLPGLQLVATQPDSRRRIATGKVREILWSAGRRLRRAVRTSRGAGESVEARRPAHDWLARGPPGSSAL